MLKIFNQNNENSIISEIGGRKAITSPPTPLLIKERGRENAKQSRKNNCKYLIEGEIKMLKIKSNRKAAFTLAETLITVVILGILAAILVPNLIKNQVENANRTKVKKAMASYEKAINMMIIENDIKSTEALRELGQDNCQYTREYFKTVQDGSSNCIFKTADRVWWDITDITNPILILKDSQLDKSETELKTLAKNVNDSTTFAMVGRFDDLGTLRINDNAYEQGLENNLTNQKYVGKLWYFITQSPSVLTGFDRCKAEKSATCIVTVNGEDIVYNLISIPAINSEYYVKKYASTDISEENAKSEENCRTSMDPGRCVSDGDYWNYAKTRCEAQGARLPDKNELSALYAQGEIITGWSNNGNCGSGKNKWCAIMLYRNGNITTNGKSSTPQVICIGN